MFGELCFHGRCRTVIAGAWQSCRRDVDVHRRLVKHAEYSKSLDNGFVPGRAILLPNFSACPIEFSSISSVTSSNLFSLHFRGRA